MLSTGLRYFVTVAVSRSMREAASQLRITQSAISRQIQKLEEEMDVRLLDRGARGVRLTSAGEVLLYHAKEMVQRNEQLKADIESVRGARRGHVAVRVVENFASTRLPDVLEVFCTQYPAVTLDISVARTPTVIDALKRGECHIGVAFNPAHDGELMRLASHKEPQLVMMSPRHPLARQPIVRLSQLLEYPVVGPGKTDGGNSIFEAAWQAENLICRPMLRTNSIHIVAGVLRGGRATAFASISRTRPYLSTGQIVAIPSTSAVLAQGRTDLLVRRSQKLPPAAAALARAMARSLEN
jgi:DNA-binding transcriptional LysR family regulator